MTVGGVGRWCVAVAAGVWMLGAGSAAAQLAQGCDEDGDEVVDGFDEATYDEVQQQMNLINFYGISMAYSPVHSPAPFKALKVVPKLELAYLPQLTCLERTVYYGTKTENTNKSPVVPRIRIEVGSPVGVYGSVAFIPPVKLFGVQTLLLGGELGYGLTLREKLELGVRAHAVYVKVVGDLAGPLEGQEAADDTYTAMVPGADLSAGYRFAAGTGQVVPYLGVGYTAVNASSKIGEDGVELPGEYEEYQALLYRGINLEVGAQVRLNRFQIGLEAYMVPIPEFRFFFSPRLTVGYEFF